MASGEAIAFTSLGMLILDEVHFPSGQIFQDVIGGSGSYASLGARLFSPRQLSIQVGYTIRQGRDFPLETTRLLKTWDINLSVIREEDRLSTRGELYYLDQILATKSFKYLTPTLFIEPKHLIGTDLLGSRCFHLFVDPSEIVEQTAQLLQLRKAAGITEQPLIIWEPRAYSCTPENSQATIDAMRVVDVFSPNHIEIARIVGMDAPTTPDKGLFERLCAPLIPTTSETVARGKLVIRAGDMGCFVKTEAQSVLLPAYYDPPKNDAADVGSKVVDTTGAGNAFLGAFAIAYLQSPGDVVSAACAGSVGASFAVEQVGVPTMTLSKDGRELWNGEEVSSRLRSYKAKVGISVDR